MASIVIVHGGAEQRGGTRSAREQYTGDRFDACREYAETVCDSWVIVSTKHDVIHPDRTIESYELVVDDFDPFEEMQWVKRIQRQLADVLFDQYQNPQFSRVVTLTDEYHTDALDHVLQDVQRSGSTVEKPLSGREEEPVEAVLKRQATR